MALSPIPAAGQRLTAARLQVGQFMVVTKGSNTDRTTTTLSADPDLTFDLAAGAIYMVEWFLHYAGPTNGSPPTTTGTIAVQWTVPSGATGTRGVRGPATNANNSNVDNISMTSGAWAFNQTVQYGARAGSSTNQSLAREEAIVITTTAGSCALSWAQATTNATATRVAQFSWGRAMRLA